MPNQSRDLVAVGSIILALDETSLKQLALMFNRIAVAGVSVISAGSLETPEFVKTRAWLLENGILFEPDSTNFSFEDRNKTANLLLEDVNSLLKPTGLNAEEAIAAQGDEKIAEMNKVRDTTHGSGWIVTYDLPNSCLKTWKSHQRQLVDYSISTFVFPHPK